MSARSIECKCDHFFTCGYCLHNRKPYFYTLHDGSAIYEIPVQRYRDTYHGMIIEETEVDGDEQEV